MATSSLDSSSTPDLVEFIASPGELVYGSLPRPPDICSVSFSRRNFMDPVCLWYLHTLSMYTEYRTLSVDDVAVLWSLSESRFLSRDGELVLEQLRQNHVCVIADAVAVMRNLEDIYASRDQDLWLERIQQILQFPIDRRWFDFWTATHVLVFTNSDKRLSSCEYIKDSLILVNLPSLCLFLKTYAGCFVTLLMLDGAHTARELFCFHMVYKIIRHGLHELQNLLQIMENSYEKCWFLLACLHPAQFNSPVSARYFQRQGEIWSSRTYRLPILIHENGLWLMSSKRKNIYVAIVFALISPHELLLKQRLFLLLHVGCQEYLQRSHRDCGQNRVNGFFGCMTVANSSRFNILLGCVYGSLQRPWVWLENARGNGDNALCLSTACYSYGWFNLLKQCFSTLTSLRFEEAFFVCVSPGCCYLDHVVRIPQELLLRQFLLHQLPRIWLFGWLQRFQQQTAILKRLQKQILLLFFIQEQSHDCGCQVLLQGLSREVDFIGQNVKASLGWFGSFLTFFYGSSPRPPDDRCAFGFTPLKFSWGSQAYRVF